MTGPGKVIHTEDRNDMPKSGWLVCSIQSWRSRWTADRHQHQHRYRVHLHTQTGLGSLSLSKLFKVHCITSSLVPESSLLFVNWPYACSSRTHLNPRLVWTRIWKIWIQIIISIELLQLFNPTWRTCSSLGILDPRLSWQTPPYALKAGPRSSKGHSERTHIPRARGSSGTKQGRKLDSEHDDWWGILSAFPSCRVFRSLWFLNWKLPFDFLSRFFIAPFSSSDFAVGFGSTHPNWRGHLRGSFERKKNHGQASTTKFFGASRRKPQELAAHLTAAFYFFTFTHLFYTVWSRPVVQLAICIVSCSGVIWDRNEKKQTLKWKLPGRVV